MINRRTFVATSASFTISVAAAADTVPPQHAGLLNRYAYKPSWQVAGVDYAVGPRPGTIFKTPASNNLPAGVSFSSTQLTINGNNVTLDGYDCSNFAIVVFGANCALTNCKFNGINLGGVQGAVISGALSSSNLYIGYCIVDGSNRAGFVIEMEGTGSLTVENSWVKNGASDLIGCNGNNPKNIYIRNNLMEQAGMVAGAHGDYLQVYGPTIDNTVITGNTAIQNGGTTQGFFADNTKRLEIGNNVMIGSVSYWVSASGPGTKPGVFQGPATIHDNYFDVRNAYGFAYGPAFQGALPKFTHNVNMVTGELVQN